MGVALVGEKKTQKFPNPFPQKVLKAREMSSWKWERKDDFK